MHHVQIMGMNRIVNADPNKLGLVILGYFSAVVNGIRMNGCVLGKEAKRGLVVYPPRLHGPTDETRKVVFQDASLRTEITSAARAAYLALGGIESDFIPTQDQIDRHGKHQTKTKNYQAAERRLARQKPLPAPIDLETECADETAGLARFLDHVEKP